MSEVQLSNTNKRQLMEKHSPQSNGSSPSLKKPRVQHPSGSRPPPAFWDNLSRHWLTRKALRELDRRNSHLKRRNPSSPFRRRHPLLTRGALAKGKSEQNRLPDEGVAEHLSRRSLKHLEGIKLFARHGGPDLQDLRGHPEPVNPLDRTTKSRQSTSRDLTQGSRSGTNTKRTTKTMAPKKSGPYDRNFQQNLVDHGFYPNRYEFPGGQTTPQPDNWETIQQRLARRRPSLSLSQFPEEKFRNFIRAEAHAAKEMQVADSVIPIIEGRVEDAKCVAGGIPFKNLDHLTDGQIVPGNPDRYYGARPNQLNRQVRRELSKQIVPTTQHDLPVAPNFFLAVKSPDGSPAVADRQASYDGALGARGMHSLHSFSKGELANDNHAHTITSTHHAGQLKMYTSHPALPTNAGDGPEYHMTQIGAYSLTHSPEAFREGLSAFRNGRDWTEEERNAAITAVNEVVAERVAKSSTLASTKLSQSSNGRASMESNTSADELALEPASSFNSSREKRKRQSAHALPESKSKKHRKG